jgi:YbbR domain-containing protein
MIRLLRNLFFSNGWLKLISLLLAFVLWLTLVPEEKISSEKTFVVPLEVRNIPDEFELVEKSLATIDVTVRAPNRLLSQITSSNIEAVVNMEKATLKQEDYPLNPDIVSVPPEAKVVRVFPNKVRLKLERSVQASMEISPVLTGQIRTGYKIEKIEISPSKVPVRGPESKVNIKDRVRTSPVDITDLAQTSEFDVDLILPKPDLRFATAQTKAKVRVVLALK